MILKIEIVRLYKMNTFELTRKHKNPNEANPPESVINFETNDSLNILSVYARTCSSETMVSLLHVHWLSIYLEVNA